MGFPLYVCPSAAAEPRSGERYDALPREARLRPTRGVVRYALSPGEV